MASQPTDLDGLRKLYFTEFVPLYDYLCSKLENLPSELHFEVTAAFDHVMRAGLECDGRKFEAENYAKASGHLKRATFDAFKLLYKYTMRPLWKKLTRRPCCWRYLTRQLGLLSSNHYATFRMSQVTSIPLV